MGVFTSNLSLLYRFFLALALGALMGIEREKNQQKHQGTDFAGIRTFMIITFFGCLTAYLSDLYFEMLLAIMLVCFVVVVMAGYILSSIFNKDIGMTTELSAIIAFIIGIITFKASQEIPILLAIVVTLILSLKSHLHKFVYNLKNIEFYDTIKFLLIAFVILPLLKPIPTFGPYDAISLYEIWLMVVFVSALSYIGYVLIKILGSDKGSIVTGLLGGILSSTAVVTSLANKTKKKDNARSYVIAAGIASTTMFLRVLIEVAILNIAIIEKLAFPMLLLALAGYASASILWRRKEEEDTDIDISSPLMLKPALKFGLFYAFILVATRILYNTFDETGILLSGLISGFADVDAITIFIARNPDGLAIEPRIGVLAIVLAAITNTVVKMFIAKAFGGKNFGTKFLKIMAPVVITGLFMLLIL